MKRAARFAELDAAIAAMPPESQWEPRFRGEPPLLRRERIAYEREIGRRPPARHTNRHVLPPAERRLKYLLDLGRIEQIHQEGLWLLPGALGVTELIR